MTPPAPSWKLFRASSQQTDGTSLHAKRGVADFITLRRNDHDHKSEVTANGPPAVLFDDSPTRHGEPVRNPSTPRRAC
jgi:hypothetical protein